MCLTVDAPAYVVRALDLAGRAGLDGDDLVDRDSGALFLPVLDGLLRDTPDGTIVLDCRGVTMMDASFADESFGALATDRARRSSRRGCLVVRSLSKTSLRNVELALLSRPPREPGLHNCVLLVMGEDGAVDLLGKCEEHVQRTFEMLRAHSCLTARTLADELRLDVAAASTRLKLLFNLGLARRTETRDEHGKLYLYEWPL